MNRTCNEYGVLQSLKKKILVPVVGNLGILEGIGAAESSAYRAIDLHL